MTEFNNFRAALAKKLHDQGKSPAEIRKALAEVDKRQRRWAGEQTDPRAEEVRTDGQAFAASLLSSRKCG